MDLAEVILRPMAATATEAKVSLRMGVNNFLQELLMESSLSKILV
jgi:hypothetical protein